MQTITKLFILFLVIFSTHIKAQKSNQPIVFELFTSQGCSSCPPADQLLDKVKAEYQDQNVYVLSYHVDYWNRLGWKDPFSKEEFTNYQREYASHFRSETIYTPQLVVNGSEHFTGSNSYKVNNALKKYKTAETTTNITLDNIKKEKERLQLSYHVEGKDFYKITLALTVAARNTPVKRGENSNRTLKNTNIVASRVIKQENSGEISIIVPDWITKQDQLSIIAYTQNENLKTTGATAIKL